MLKRLLLSVAAFALILLLFAWLLPLDMYFPAMFGSGYTVLVLFDEPNPNRADLDRLDALMLRQLIGHFKTYKIELVSTGEYQKGHAKKFDIVFYVGTKPEMPLPTFLLTDLYTRKKTTVWLGANLDKLAARHSLEGFGFRLADSSDEHGTNRVEYKDRSLWKLDLSTYAVDIINGEVAQVLAWAKMEREAPNRDVTPHDPKVKYAGMAVEQDTVLHSELPPIPDNLNFDLPVLPVAQPSKIYSGADARLPWIVKSKWFWYISSNPFSHHIEGGAYLAFCDVLHEIFRTKVSENHPALVRIEDVHANSDMKGHIAAADYLHSKKIPFHFTLVPVYTNPATGVFKYLSSEPEYLATVRGMIQRGGIPILHGYTHQWDGETAVDYEFWSSPDPGGRPVGSDMKYASEQVIKALSECYLADVFPLSWTTPHYAAGQVDYAAFKNFFTTVLERRQPIDRIGSDQFFPYMIYKDMHNQIIFPEDLVSCHTCNVG